MFELNRLRTHPVLKWIMYVVFGLVIISFVFFYGWHPQDERGQSQVLARMKSGKLGGGWEMLTATQVSAARRNAINNKLVLLSPQIARQLPQSMLDRLVTPEEVAQEAANQALLGRRASQLGVRITRDDIIKLLEQQPDMTNEALQAMAQEQQMDVESLLERMRVDQENYTTREIQQQAAHASLYEVWQEYELASEKIKLQLAAYPVEDYAAKIKPSEAELTRYLSEHKDKFALPDQRRYAYAKLAKSDLREKIQVTSAALQTYYEKNQAKFHQKAAFRTNEIVAPLAKDRSTTAAVKALNAARVKAAKTKDWEPLANELRRDHPELTFYQRTSPWLTADDTQNRSALFLARAAALAGDQVSTAVVDVDNVYLIRVAERRKEGTPALKDIREQVEQAYLDDQAQEQFDAAYKHWEEVTEKQKSVAGLASAIGVKDQVTTRVAVTDAYIPGFASLTKDRAYIQGLGLHELSSVIKTDDIVGALEVVEETPAHDAKLEEVREAVETAYKSEKGLDEAKAQAEQSAALLKSGAEFDKALANAPKKPFETMPFKRTDSVDGLGAPLLDFTTQTLQLTPGKTGLSRYGNSSQDVTGYAVWKVKEITRPTRGEFARDRKKYEDDLLQVQRLTMTREWLADQRKKAQFEIVKNK